MGKKYGKNNRLEGEISIVEEASNLEEIGMTDLNYENSKASLLKEINDLPNGEERTRAIRDLAEIEKISNEKEKTQIAIRQSEEELQLRKQELKQNKRNTLIGVLAQIGTVGLSILGYSWLANRQTKWEMEGNTPTTTTGREIARGSSRLLRFK